MRDGPAPARHHRVVRALEQHVGFEAGIVQQPPFLLQSVPERGLGQGLEDVDRQDRDTGLVDEVDQVLLGGIRIGVEAEDDARRDLEPVGVQRLDRPVHRHGGVMGLVDALERPFLRSLDADEDGHEVRLPHQLEDLGLLGHVQGRLAGELQRVVVLLLPCDEVREHVPRRLAVGDEVVVDEVDHGRMAGLADDRVELGAHLLGALQPRLASVELRDVAELAPVGTARRELQRSDEVALQRGRLVGRCREVGERQPLLRLQPDLGRRPRQVAVEDRHEFVRGVADLAHVEVVEVRVLFGGAGHRGTAEHRHLACGVRALGDLVDLRLLDVHARHEHRVGPGEFLRGGALDVLVDEPALPGLGHVGRDQQEALRRHEGLHAAHQRVGVGECPEGWRVGGEDAQDASLGLDGEGASHGALFSTGTRDGAPLRCGNLHRDDGCRAHSRKGRRIILRHPVGRPKRRDRPRPPTKRSARPQGPGASVIASRFEAQAPRTEPGSTFTPGPIVEVTAMRWM